MPAPWPALAVVLKVRYAFEKLCSFNFLAPQQSSHSSHKSTLNHHKIVHFKTSFSVFCFACGHISVYLYILYSPSIILGTARAMPGRAGRYGMLIDGQT